MKLHSGKRQNAAKQIGNNMEEPKEKETSREEQWDTQQSSIWKAMMTTTVRTNGRAGKARDPGIVDHGARDGKTVRTGERTKPPKVKERDTRASNRIRSKARSLVALCCDR